MPNRLAESLAPCHRQHAGNPINWQPWGPAAFAEAARRDVTVLLSIGYAVCRWWHEVDRSAAVDGNLRNRTPAA